MLNTKRRIIGLVIFLAISGMGTVLYLIKDSGYFDNLYNDDTPVKKVVKNLRLGDRFYIESVLIDVFGNSLRPVTQKYIINSAGALSGPCDNYEQVRIGDKADSFADPHSACPGGKLATTIPTIGSSSLLRQGYIAKTCEEALRDKVAFDYVLNKIFVDSYFPRLCALKKMDIFLLRRQCMEEHMPCLKIFFKIRELIFPLK